MSWLRPALLSCAAGRGGAVARGTEERGGDAGDVIVALALAVVDEETLAWLTRQREFAEQAEGSPDA